MAVVAIDKSVSVLGVKPFNGPEQALISDTAQHDEAVRYLLVLSRDLPVLSQVVVVGYVIAP